MKNNEQKKKMKNSELIIEEFLELIMNEDDIININANIGAAEDFVIEALKKENPPVVHY